MSMRSAGSAPARTGGDRACASALQERTVVEMTSPKAPAAAKAACGTDGLRTHRWREQDSNHRSHPGFWWVEQQRLCFALALWKKSSPIRRASKRCSLYPSEEMTCWPVSARFGNGPSPKAVAG